MPLTPEDVANKQFTSTRLKPGYDETEVDEFLDEVEAELTRLYRENDELRPSWRPPAAARQAPVAAAPDPALARENEDLRPSSAPCSASSPRPERSRAATTAGRSAGPAGRPGRRARRDRHRHPRPPSARSTSIAEARTQADRSSARRAPSRPVKREAEDNRQTIGSLETERSALERKVEQLRAFGGVPRPARPTWRASCAS
jgi:DivIVA domain-containing protein